MGRRRCTANVPDDVRGVVNVAARVEHVDYADFHARLQGGFGRRLELSFATGSEGCGARGWGCKMAGQDAVSAMRFWSSALCKQSVRNRPQLPALQRLWA